MNESALERNWRTVALMAALAVVLVLTMTPTYSDSSTPTFCLVCGEQGGADVVANLVLFVPVGIALALQRWKVRSQMLFAFLLTFFIESSQRTIIPGRDASLGDLLFNTLGAAVGIALVRTSQYWVAPRGGLRRVLQIGAGIVAGGVMVATGILTQPDLGAPGYRILWTERLSRTNWYHGVIESVHLGQRSLPHGRVNEPNSIGDSIAGGSKLVIRGVAGPRPTHLGPIFTIRAGRDVDIWTSGQRRDDLVFLYRPVGATFRLRVPDFHVPGAMAGIHRGDTLDLEFQHRPPGFDVRVDGALHHVTFRLRDGWRFFFPTFGAPPWVRFVLSCLWIGGLIVPIGLWMDGSWSAWVGAGIAGTAFIGTSAMRLFGSPGWNEYTGLIFGLALGIILQQGVKRLFPRVADSRLEAIPQTA